jgi:hypothetical protein
MNLVSQLQRHYEWTPNYRLVFKKPVPPELKTFKVPQTKGVSGWIVFTYENKIPVCIWVTKTGCKKVPCIVDERICGDTFIKAEQIGELDFVVADIWMYNSNCVFACSTFKQRYDWLSKLLSTFTYCVEGITIDLIHKQDLADEVPLKGFEEHPLDGIGSTGYFVEKSNLQTITKLEMPDCYSVNGKGYLNVPDLKTSLYLRSKGTTFQCKCERVDDEFWNVIENIPE